MGLRDKIAEEQADAFMEEVEARLEESKERPLSDTAYAVVHGQFKVHLTIGIKKWVRTKLEENASKQRQGLSSGKQK